MNPNDPNVQYPAQIRVEGKMVLKKPSRIDRVFKGEAHPYQPGRLFGETYVRMDAARVEYDQLKERIAQLEHLLRAAGVEVPE